MRVLYGGSVNGDNAAELLGAGDVDGALVGGEQLRSEEHTSELQSLMLISYAVFCLKKKNKYTTKLQTHHQILSPHHQTTTQTHTTRTVHLLQITRTHKQ